VNQVEATSWHLGTFRLAFNSWYICSIYDTLPRAKRGSIHKAVPAIGLVRSTGTPSFLKKRQLLTGASWFLLGVFRAKLIKQALLPTLPIASA
jgi:hypothetical protein